MRNKILLAIVLVLTLGLAPYFPEPHILKQFNNLFLAGGATMGFMDWFDLFLHGLPWAYALAVIGDAMRKTLQKTDSR